MTRTPRATPLLVAAVVALSAAGITAPQDLPVPEPCGPTWTAVPSPNVGEGDNELLGVSTITSTDVWAVGHYRDELGAASPLTLHWGGEEWAVVPAPRVEGADAFLTAVDAASAADVWAVGYSVDDTGNAQTLTLHWDGASWSVVPSPNLVEDDDNYVQGVKAIAPGDVWAVGYAQVLGYETLTMHWDGRAWTAVPGPDPVLGGGQYLYAVDGTSSSDLWAVGTYFDEGLDFFQPLFGHWDGETWTPYEFPGIQTEWTALGAVAISSDDVWTVGRTGTDPNFSSAFAQHWNGLEWDDDLGNPDNQGDLDVLARVAALSASDLWSVGYYTDEVTGTERTNIQHWDGEPFAFWTPVESPNVGEGDNRLTGVGSVAGSTELWSVGSYADDATGALRTLIVQACPEPVDEDDFASEAVVVDHQGATMAWSVLPGAGSHSITDASGLDLFTSGPLEAPASFLHRFFAAGTYPVLDRGMGDRMSVKVPMAAYPRRGNPSTRFRIVWANDPGRLAPNVFDVQVRRPGSGEYVDWLVAQPGFSGTFVPDAGPGVYRFRARVRDPGSGEAIGYSPPVSIQVG
jgi:hypothetical protein